MSDPTTETTAPNGYREWLIIGLKGFAMGAADAVPGVSGGTIALITGIYERLIAAVTSLDPALLRFIPRLHRSADRAEFQGRLFEIDLPFLVVLGVGVVSAVVTLSRVMHLAIKTVPAPTFAFFAGLIGASAVVLGEREWVRRPDHVLAGIVGFAIAFLIAGASSAGLFPKTLPMVFFAGVIGICGMVLPGISGAFILLLLGQYEYLTGKLSRLVDQLINLVIGGETGNLVGDGAVVATFIAGAFVGLMTTAYGVRWALERYRTQTFAFLVSLMVGALRYPALQVAETGPTGPALAVTVAAAVVGTILILILDYFTEDLAYAETSQL